MKSKIIAVDFDGTLCENKWPEIGEPNNEVIAYIKKEKENGSKIILWTCRTGDLLKKAIDWCDRYHQLQFDMINANIQDCIREFGEDTRKIFAHEYIDDRANTKFNLPYLPEEKSNMMSWAEREIDIACKRERDASKTDEWDYGCACYGSALKAYKSLCRDGHSGISIGMTKHILNRLIEGKPLTPIEDVPEIWNDICDYSGLRGEEVNYQCKRMSSLFKYVYADGTIKYCDVDNHYCFNINNPNSTYHSGLVQRLMDDMFPITMPYCPGSPIKIACEDFLTDKKNGDFDTVGVLYAINPDGERTEINRFFKESDNEFVEIDEREYNKRKECKINAEN